MQMWLRATGLENAAEIYQMHIVYPDMSFTKFFIWDLLDITQPLI